MGLGGLAYLVPFVDLRLTLAVALLATLGNLWVLPRLPRGLRLEREGGERGRVGLVLYPAVLAFLAAAAWVFPDRRLAVAAAWLAMAVGDGLAPVVARHLRGPAFPWNRAKRLGPTAVAYGLAALAVWPLIPWPLALASMGLAGLSESLPRVNDNLSVPLVAFSTVALLGGPSGGA